MVKNKMNKRKGTFYVVPDFVVAALKLSHTEKDVFSIIYGFSQARGNWFTGSVDYICKRLGCGKSAVHEALKNLITKKFIMKREVCYGFVKYCCYSYNYEVVDTIIEQYEGIPDEELDNITLIIRDEQPVLVSNTGDFNPETNTGNPETNTGETEKSELPVLESKVNNKVNIEYNKNIISTHSKSAKKTNPFDITLKDKQKEEKEIKKIIKNKTELIEKDILENITTEKMSDIDNDEVKKNREAAAQRAAEREARLSIAKNKNVKKARLKRAAELFPEKDILDLLDEFLDSYLFSYNLMSKQSWEYILEDLSKIPESKRIDSIRNSIAGGYRKIFYAEPRSNKYEFDNTRNHITDEKALHEFTEQEWKEYDKKLARNADGSYMTF